MSKAPRVCAAMAAEHERLADLLALTPLEHMQRMRQEMQERLGIPEGFFGGTLAMRTCHAEAIRTLRFHDKINLHMSESFLYDIREVVATNSIKDLPTELSPMWRIVSEGGGADTGGNG